MQLEYRTGDILQYEGKYICQGVNTLGVMGAGLALQIRNTYPKVWEVYSKKKLVLGDAFGVECDPHTILCIATQKDIGRHKKPFNYTAFEIGLSKIDKAISGEVAFPPIGCGLGGGNFRRVREILLSCKQIKPIVYYLNDEIPPEFLSGFGTF